MLRKFLVTCLLITPALTFANSAQICNNCQTNAKAISYAKSQANDLVCSATFDQNFNCTSRNNIVTFVDRDTEEVYRFNVYHERTYPWEVRTEPFSLSTDERFAFSNLITFYNDFVEIINDVSSTSGGTTSSLLSNSFTPKALISNVIASSSSTESTCPANTALSALVNPEELEHIQDIASRNMASRFTVNETNRFNLNPTARNSVYGLAYRGFNYSLSDQGVNRAPAYVVGFEESERTTTRPDFLAFGVVIDAYDVRGIPVVSFKLLDSSRVAGYSLGSLRGNNGPLTIDNDCVRERLNDAVARGVLSVKNTAIGGGTSGSVGGDGDTSGGGTTGIPSGSASSCRITEFFQGGRLLYTFRDCS